MSELNENDIVTKGFRDKLENHEFPVDKGLWSKIERDLPAGAPLPKPYRRLWWYAGGAAASIALVVSLFLGINRHSGSGDLLLAKQTVPETIQEQNGVEKDPETIEENSPETGRPLQLPAKQHTAAVIPDRLTGGDPVAEELKNGQSPVVPEEEMVRPDEAVASEETKETPQKGENRQIFTLPDLATKEWDEWEKTVQSIKKGNNLSLALSYGNQGSANNPDGGVLQRYSNSFSALRVDSKLESENVVISDTRYKTPVTAAFTVRKYLNRNWAVESGVMYTYLESSEMYTTLSDGQSYTREFQMHYIGIPVKAVYSFLEKDRLSLYASAGGAVEKAVYAREKNSYNDMKREIDVNKLQWSVSASIGLNFRLANHIGLFAEPGIAYYFDDKSNIPSIRKDKPWNFSLQAGLRLSY